MPRSGRTHNTCAPGRVGPTDLAVAPRFGQLKRLHLTHPRHDPAAVRTVLERLAQGLGKKDALSRKTAIITRCNRHRHLHWIFELGRRSERCRSTTPLVP